MDINYIKKTNVTPCYKFIAKYYVRFFCVGEEMDIPLPILLYHLHDALS